MAGRDDAPAPAATAGGVLTIDLCALRENYRTLRDMAPRATCAAVVKGNAYGIGTEQAVESLARAGCQVFFVALTDEGLIARRTVPDATVYVLNGLPAGACGVFERHRLRPVLGSMAEVEEWAGYCRTRETRLPAALHVDTGMNRLGLEAGEFKRLVKSPRVLEDFSPALIMSHLACADEPSHPMNVVQNELLAARASRLPAMPISLANSAGVMIDDAYHHDVVRPGVALYGGNAVPGTPNRMKPVVHLSARILQIRDVGRGESVGYGATWTSRGRSRIAVISAGYADGYFRKLGADNSRTGAMVHVGGCLAPVVGRVSMDMITVDITDVDQADIGRGSMVELLGHHVGVDDLAAAAGTIGYEVLTSLGSRYARVYSGA